MGILHDEQVGLNKLFLNVRFLKLLTREPNKYAGFVLR